jgi:hypothetical protein
LNIPRILPVDILVFIADIEHLAQKTTDTTPGSVWVVPRLPAFGNLPHVSGRVQWLDFFYSTRQVLNIFGEYQA